MLSGTQQTLMLLLSQDCIYVGWCTSEYVVLAKSQILPNELGSYYICSNPSSKCFTIPDSYVNFWLTFLLWHLSLPVLPPPDPPTSVTVENTREKRIIIVSWTPPALGSRVTGYHVFIDTWLKASVIASQTKVSCKYRHRKCRRKRHKTMQLLYHLI